MRNWKLIAIIFQAIIFIAVVLGLSGVFYKILNWGLKGGINIMAFWFVLGLVQVVDSIINHVYKNNFFELNNRRWHFIYLAAVSLPFLIGDLGHLLHIPDLQIIIFYDMMVLLVTSPIMATAVFIQMVKEYNKITFNNRIENGTE